MRLRPALRRRFIALILLVVASILLALQPAWLGVTANPWFDVYQRLMPRHTVSKDVVIVAIDEDTLAAIGQWPWPRNFLAALVDNIAQQKPKVIGMDIIFPESDHASPEALSETRPDLPINIRNGLKQATSNDAIFAQSIRFAPIVLGAAGFSFPTTHTLVGLKVAPIILDGDASKNLKSYPYVLASLPELQLAAKSQALLLTESENGLIRRSSLLANVSGTVTPNLSLELLRVGMKLPTVNAEIQNSKLNALVLGNLRIPVAPNGDVWVHFDANPDAGIISALDVFKGSLPMDVLKDKYVLVGLTGLGLTDWITSARGDRRPGVEIHAQLIQSFLDGRFVTRPMLMPVAELCLMLGLGLALIRYVPKLPPKRSVFLWLGIFIATILAGFYLFWRFGLLFDAANLNICLSILFVWLLIDVLSESQRQRKLIGEVLQQEREVAAKVAGELEAARRIQLNSLPDTHIVFANEKRFEIASYLEPAREIGGDLYDCFMLDDKRLFLAVGDVSGKGVPASLFMAVTRALSKSLALRGDLKLAEVMTAVNAELSRDNPEMLFVTMIAAVINIETGQLDICNAGHEAPWHWASSGKVTRLLDENGPPLCMLDDFKYETKLYTLEEGDLLLMVSDGVTEAMNTALDLYGSQRVSNLMLSLSCATTAENLKDALCKDVQQFVGAAEPSDDITMLVLQWHGQRSKFKQ